MASYNVMFCIVCFSLLPSGCAVKADATVQPSSMSTDTTAKMTQSFTSSTSIPRTDSTPNLFGNQNLTDFFRNAGALVPELRGLLEGRTNLNGDQLQLLYKYAQMIMNSNSGNAMPSSLQQLLRMAQDSGLLRTGSLNPADQNLGPYSMSWPKCQIDLVHYFIGLNTSQTWALTMLDASGKPGPSILQGNLRIMGNYLQCNDVHYSNVATYASVHGKICRAVIAPPFDIPGIETFSLLPVPSSGHFLWDICLPKSCDGDDLNRQLAQFNITSDVVSVQCTPEFDLSDDPSAIGALSVLGFLGALMLLGTLLDVYVHLHKERANEYLYHDDNFHSRGRDDNKSYEMNRTTPEEPTTNGGVYKKMEDSGEEMNGRKSINGLENGNCVGNLPKVNGTIPHEKMEEKETDRAATLPKWQRALLAFSIPRNTKKILGVKATPGSIGCLHGIRVMSMGWVILGHSFTFLATMMENPLNLLSRLHQLSFQTIINGTLSVDTFFLMSGLLTSYLFLKVCGKRRRVTLKQGIMYYVHRYWRLTPPLMMWIMVVTTLLKYVGAGRPGWVDYYPAINCRTNWWINLLYINNVYKQRESCVGVTWYLAHDMQFYVVAPLALIPWAYGKKVLGFLMASVLIGIHVAATIWVELDINGDMLRNQAEYVEFIYLKPYTRVAPFAIGLMFGWILWKTKGKLRMNKYVVIIGWIMSLGLILTLTLVTYDENQYEDLERLNAGWSHAGRLIHETLQRPLWALAVGWIVLACANGYGGYVNSILSWGGWLPMSRLTYCVFLVHLTVIMFESLIPEYTFLFTTTSLSYHFLGNTAMAFAVGFILAVSVEAPMLALEKVILN